MTSPTPNDETDGLGDLRCVMRSVFDAMNLVNLRWFLYDEARREAWLKEHEGAAARRRSKSMPQAGARKDRPAPGSDQAA